MRGLFADHNVLQGKTIDLGYYRWTMGIHARDLNHDPPPIIAMIGMQLVMVLLFGVYDIYRILTTCLHRCYGKKEAYPQGIHHCQTGSRRSVDPGGGGKIQCVRGNVARSPLYRIQCFQVSLEAEFSGTPRQSNTFKRGLKKIAIRVFVAVGSLLSNRILGSSRKVRKAVAERIVRLGRLLLM